MDYNVSTDHPLREPPTFYDEDNNISTDHPLREPHSPYIEGNKKL